MWLKKCIYILITGIFIFLFIPLMPQDTMSSVEVLNKMFKETEKIKTLECNLKKKEKINGKLKEQRSYMKLNTDPLKVYIKQLEPSEGMEILFIKGKYNNKAVINPNGFPWVNLWLDPMSDKMRNGQHHNIYRSGFSYVMDIFRHMVDKHQNHLQQIIKMNGKEIVEGYNCYKITYSSSDFYYYNYSVKKGETITSIANKFMISEYKILEKNKNLDSYTQELHEGQSITIPSEYAKSMILYIHTQKYVPVKIQVYDKKGLFEEYKYPELNINPDFNDQAFSLNNPEYGF